LVEGVLRANLPRLSSLVLGMMTGNRVTMRHSHRMNSVALAFAVYGRFARGSLLTDASLLRIAQSEKKSA